MLKPNQERQNMEATIPVTSTHLYLNPPLPGTIFSLPWELQTYIFSLVGNPPLTQQICRLWKDLTRSQAKELLGVFEEYLGIEKTQEGYWRHLVMPYAIDPYFKIAGFEKTLDETIKKGSDVQKLSALVEQQEKKLKRLFGLLPKTFLKTLPPLSSARFAAMEQWMPDFNLLLMCSKIDYSPKNNESGKSLSQIVSSTIDQVWEGNFEISEAAQKMRKLLSNNDFSDVIMLDFNSCGLTELPKEIAHFSQIKTLILFNNNLTDLPPEFTQLSQLTHLTFKCNQFLTIPKGVAELKNLMVLCLSFNPLLELSEEIKDLPLRELAIPLGFEKDPVIQHLVERGVRVTYS